MEFGFRTTRPGIKSTYAAWLDRAIDARDPVVTHLPSMSLYDGIRDDLRFRALLARMHLA